MDPKVWEKLEFDKIRSLLAAHASFSGGKSLAEQLEPTASLEQAERWQQETAEALALLERHGPPPFGGLSDVRPAARRARVGAVLSPEELLAVADAARALAGLREYVAADALRAASWRSWAPHWAISAGWSGKCGGASTGKARWWTALPAPWPRSETASAGCGSGCGSTWKRWFALRKGSGASRSPSSPCATVVTSSR